MRSLSKALLLVEPTYAAATISAQRKPLLARVAKETGADKTGIHLLPKDGTSSSAERSLEHSPEALRDSLIIRTLAELHERQTSLELLGATYSHALDLLRGASLGIDGRGRVHIMNDRAKEILKTGEWITAEQRALRTTVPAEQERLNHLLISTCRYGAGLSSDPGPGGIVLHGTKARKLYVSASPFRADSKSREAGVTALVFLIDPSANEPDNARLWRALFSLTAVECRVVALLLQGMSPRQIAPKLNSTPASIRFYLKSIFGKTGVKRQADLVCLLSRFPSLPNDLHSR